MSKKPEKKTGKYAKLMEQAKKDKSLKQLSVEITKWEEEGQFIIGKLMSVVPYKSKKFKDEVLKYTFDTDEGLTSCICGASVDPIFQSENLVGSIIMITYQGKTELDSGNRMNVFEVIMIDKQVND